MKSIKGQTREYRKALRNTGNQHFPTHGAFHVRHNTDRSCVVPPENVNPLGDYVYIPGPAPAPQHNDILSVVEPNGPDDLPALPVMYVRRERISSTDGKKRIDYSIARNPKPGQTYYVKQGKKYVPTSLDKIAS